MLELTDAIEKRSQNVLTWGLAIATYNRADVLLKSVQFALQQTRPPLEIVICDSSNDWAESRQAVEQLLVQTAPNVRLWYGTSRVAQQTVQRNVVIENAKADILFMIDDDSFLHRNAAETIMRVYESDSCGSVAAVGVEVMMNWNGIDTISDTPKIDRSFKKSIIKIVLNILGFHFWARNKSCPDYQLPAVDLPIRMTLFLDGFRITVRRCIAADEKFDEFLVSNRFEDSDACYRFAQRGAVVMIDKALIYHAAAVNQTAKDERQGILSRFGWILNAAYLNRKLFGSSIYVRVFCLSHLFRLTPLDLVIGLKTRNFSRIKGVVLVLRPLMRLTFAPHESIGRIVSEETARLRARLASKRAAQAILDESGSS